MAKKRAFVRYSKQGKIVPGSLILTAGSYPNGSSTWKEVPADLCCDTTCPASCNSQETINLSYFSASEGFTGGFLLQLACDGNFFSTSLILQTTTTRSETVSALNTIFFPIVGEFSLDQDDNFIFTLNECQYKTFCPQGVLSFEIIQAP